MGYPEHVLAVRLLLNLGPDWRSTVSDAIDALEDEEVDYLAGLIEKVQKLQLRTANKTAGGRGGIDYNAQADRAQHATTIATLLGLPDPTVGFLGTVTPSDASVAALGETPGSWTTWGCEGGA